jgi:Ca2+-binding EF-hand superfamily protein
VSRARALAAVSALLLGGAGAAVAQSSGSYFDIVDRDHDGRISLAEYQDRLSYAFRQMDRNHDDVVDEGEQLVRGSPRMSLAELHAQLAAQFRRQDKNHDGSLSPREFLAPPA